MLVSPQPLSRRELLRRAARASVGAGAVVLVGCGDSDAPQTEAPAPANATTQQQTAPQSQQTAAPAQTEPPEQEPDAPQAQADPQPQVEQTQQQTAPQAQQAAPVQQQAAQPTVSARRRLVPDVECQACSLEDPAFQPAAGATAEWGVIDGAGYRIEVPDDWNGGLVLWAHGFTGLNATGTGVTNRLSFSMPERALLLGQGYAWATSTYRAPGYVPGLGVDELLLVKDRVAALYDAPGQTLCIGPSMGGATAQLMAQEFPEEIAGALAYCPALGNVWVADYLAAWHAVAHWFIGEAPSRTDALGLIEWARPLGSFGATGIELTPAGEQFAAVIEQLTGGPRWAFRSGFESQWLTSFGVGALTWPTLAASAPFEPGELIDLGDAEAPIDTTGFVFDVAEGIDVDIERLNAEVIRVRSNPERRADPGVGIPSGRLEVPLVCLKTTGDLFTPIHLERDYQRLVADSGHADNLVMRAVRRAGHCTFSAQEWASAFSALVGWVDYGIKPLGEDLTGDLSQAGAAFTDRFDANDPLAPA